MTEYYIGVYEYMDVILMYPDSLVSGIRLLAIGHPGILLFYTSEIYRSRNIFHTACYQIQYCYAYYIW